VRVVAGLYKGRRLHAPPGSGTRPTADRVREALFSILGDRVDGAAVLDLFAGSGALGIEALSRGAVSATFVDDAAGAVRAVKANLATLGITAPVHRADATRWLRSAEGQYDLVFLDPPYRDAARLGPELSPLLPAAAIVVSESDRRAPLELLLPLSDERRYGDTLIRIHDPR
jgi:16S rRNA (guanine966-N2)-methyltransferase